MYSKHSLPIHVSIWLLIPSLEFYLSFSHPYRHEAWQFVLEFACFAFVGAAQWRMAKRHWMGSLLTAGFVPLILAMLSRAPSDMLTGIFFVAGVALLSIWPLKLLVSWIEDRRSGRAAVALGAALALLGTLAGSAIDLHAQLQSVGGRMGDIEASFGSQLAKRMLWPLQSQDLHAGSSEAPPIILVTVDTLRADDALEMETHRWLAKRGRWWPSAMSTSSWTLPSVASIQTGLLPGEHGATCLYDAHCQGLAKQVPTLAEDLAARDYRTIALTTNPWISDRKSVARGYQQVIDYASLSPIRLAVLGQPSGPDRQDASVLVDATLAKLEQLPKRGYLLWLHLIDPHMPYPHTPDLTSVTVKSLRAGASTSEKRRIKIRNAYRREVAHVDTELMRLIDWLEQDEFFERGILILTSDHGEEFWEHGSVEHGHSHHAEVLEVPLAIAGLGVRPGKDSGVASLIDIAPTVRAIAGVEHSGQDLRAGTSTNRILSAQGVMVGPLIRSARDDKTRVIVKGDERFEPLVVQRYDLITDPEERKPSLPSSEDPVARTALELTEPVVGEVLPVNQEALRALGYIE